MIFVYVYLAIGFGFSVAAWLEAECKNVSEGAKPLDSFSFVTAILFVLFWPIIAIYIFRSGVTKTIPTYEQYMKMKGK